MVIRRSRIVQALMVAMFFAMLPFGMASASTHGNPNELLMFEQQGCPFCAAWDRDVGASFAKTDEARILPLRRVDLHHRRAGDGPADPGVRFTPTFLVMHCGKEMSRIVGYASQDQFWGLLDADIRTLKDAPPCSTVSA